MYNINQKLLVTSLVCGSVILNSNFAMAQETEQVPTFQLQEMVVTATKTLKEYITKGFVLNDDMLKNCRPFGKDYFDELLERIREIRASERRAYQKITDVFEQCSYDYDKNSEINRILFDKLFNQS